MSNLETYLNTLTTLRGATVPETSYYAVLQTLLNDVGAGLRPRVQVVIHPKDTGAGIPDLGLYDDNQPADQKPARGIIEAKPVSDDLLRIAQGEQVARYVAHYGQALVTNYYQFVLVTRNAQTGQSVIEERYDLAPSAGAFWEAAKHPRTLAQQHETALREYLMRVMRRNAPLSTPQDVAWILASYAREARARIEAGGSDLAALNTIRGQLEASLGVRFEDETAEDFFRSTLVQTLFYGLFSAWVLWHEKHPGAGKFDLWRDTRRMNMPVISELFNQFSDGTYLPLSVEQILEWTADALNRVDRAAFFASFNTGAAVQYFYEPFLEAFDPELRRQLGVWYTPPEVVEYMVERVDAALKTELGIADGLADPSVYVLDPCCGTGAYLVAVLRHIYAALRSRDGEALAAQAVQRAMRERVFGFEILPAPFVVAHLQIGMLLNNLRAPLDNGQRAGVYLTNALTGWETPTAPKTALLFPELQKERDAADTVKRGRPILVILGNPPYSGYAGVAIEEERTLTNAYRTTQNPKLPRPQGQGLNDLYIRFYRMAERQIAETTQRGVACFISNYSWLDGLSHTGMRERYLNAFDRIIIDNLHGDRIISEYAPDGRSSETVFAIRGNSAGIRIGTAIATLIRKPGDSTSTPRATLYYHDWDQARADERRQALLDSVGEEAPLTEYQIVKPAVEIGLPFKPRVVGADYFAWAKLPELFPVSFPGVKTSRDDALVAIDQSQLVDRMRTYLDPTVTEDVIAAKLPSLMKDSGRFNAREVRKALLSRNYTGIIVRYGYRPFDVRWLYWDADTKLLDEKRPEFVPHVKPENLFLFTTGRTRKNLIEAPIFTRLLNDLNLMDSGARGFPLYIYDATQMAQLELIPTEAKTSGRRPNLSDQAKAYLAGIYSSPPAPSPLYGEGKKLPYAQVYGGAALWEKIKPLARQMRHEPTKAEAVLWDVLRGRRFEGNKFRRQHPIDRFIVDFYCAEAHLVIEVDGEIHDYTPDEDVLRQQFIESRGLRVMRFRNVQVLDDLPGVLDTIQAALTPPLQAVERRVGSEDIPLEQQAETLFYHTLAVLHSPAYRVENAGALRQDWPRVPLPKTREALEASAALGRQVAALLDVETPVPGVTQGDPRPELRSIGVLMSANGGAPDFTINVNWGYFGAGSAVMPGRGRAVEADGLIDVYLNASTYWKGIPTAVWEYTLGGYQVLKKWLSYRETAVLGRPLKAEEAREFMHIARRIAALLALNDALDVNYRAVSGQ